MFKCPIHKRQDNVFITATLVLTISLEAYDYRHLYVVGAGYAFVDAVTID